MFGLPHSAGHSNDVGADFFHPSATPQRCFEQTFGSEQSSDLYGYDIGTESLRRFATDQAGTAPWSSESFLTPVLQAGYNSGMHLR